MARKLGYVSLLVRDYDEALAFFTTALGFHVIEDTPLSENKRWVLLAPPGSSGTSLLLARASTPEQITRIGNQADGRVFLFLHTDDFWRDCGTMRRPGAKLREAPREEALPSLRISIASVFGGAGIARSSSKVS